MPSQDLSDARPETLALHAGWRADPTSGSVAVPIHQTTSYQFRDTDHAESLFALKELGNIYTRVTNPTVDVLEQRLAALEGGAAALALASGQAASALAVQNLARAGDNIVSSTDLYGDGAVHRRGDRRPVGGQPGDGAVRRSRMVESPPRRWFAGRAHDRLADDLRPAGWVSKGLRPLAGSQGRALRDLALRHQPGLCPGPAKGLDLSRP